MTAKVTLRKIGGEDRAAYERITLTEEQKVFGGAPEDAFDNRPDGHEQFGIEQDGVPVGLFRIDTTYPHYDFARDDEVGLRYFLVDNARQGRGIAGAALAALPALLAKYYPDSGSIALTVNCRNPEAYRVYARAGFVDTGELYLGGGAGPQHVMRMMLR